MGVFESILQDHLIKKNHVVVGTKAKSTFVIAQDIVLIHAEMGLTKFLWT